MGQNVQEFLQQYTDDPGSLIGPLAQIGLSVVGILGALIFMLLTAFYIAVNPQPLVNGLLSLFPPGRRDAANHLTLRLRTAWVGWLEGVLIDMFVTGVLLYLGLTLIGLEFAIFFAVFSALLVVIPYFGAVIGAVPVFLFALADSPTKAVLALVVYIIVQQIEGNVIIPLVMAQRVKLHPALIAIGVVLVGQLFGFIGLFVAVPILSAIVILVDELWVKPMEGERGISSGHRTGGAGAAQRRRPAAAPATAAARPDRLAFASKLRRGEARMGMFDLTMTDEQVAEYREMVRGLAAGKVSEPIVAAGLFRRGGSAAKMGISKGGLGGIAYAGAALFSKKQAGGMPDKALLVATADKIHAYKAKFKGRKWVAGDEVAVWDRAGLRISGRPSMGLTMLEIESPSEGEKVSLAPIGVKDDPVSLEFIQALSTS